MLNPESKSDLVLVVDDRTSTRELLCRYVLELGYQPIASSDKNSALKEVKNNTFSWAIIDIALRGDDDQDGLYVGQELHLKQPVPILFISGLEDKYFKKVREEARFGLFYDKLNRSDLPSFPFFRRYVTQFLENSRTGRFDIYSGSNQILGDDNQLVSIPEIVYVRVDDKDSHYMNLHLTNGERTYVRKSLHSFTNVSPYLLRINRKTVININFIVKFDRYKWKKPTVTVKFMNEEKSFNISRNLYNVLLSNPYFDAQLKK